MKVFIAVLATLFAIGLASDVLVLDSSNFDEALKKHEVLLVEFYAPWCGHCKKLEPEFDSAAKTLKASNLYIAKVDADNEANRELATRFGIRGFPTLKFFRNGEFESDFDGQRTAEGIVSFLKKQTLPAVSHFETKEDLEKLRAEHKVLVVGFFESQNSDYEAYSKLANTLRNRFTFGAVVGKDALAKEYEAKPSQVVLFKKFDEGRNDLTDLSTLAEFIKVNSVPLIDEIGPENYKDYVDSGLPLAYIFVELSKEGQRQQYEKVFTDIAKEAKGKMNWVFIDWGKFAKHSERLGLSGTKVPAVAIEHEGRHFAYDEEAEINGETMAKWVKTYLSGELAPTIKSEPLPDNTGKSLTKLVAKNFDEIALDPKKDVLVEFYAPWCGHCKSLQPIYEELAEKFKDVDSVVIAQIDATANDVDPSFGIKGFPTLKFFPAKEGKAPVEYSGNRQFDDLLEFVKTNSLSEYKL
jgi:protein disulfide-isomerase A1